MDQYNLKLIMNYGKYLGNVCKGTRDRIQRVYDTALDQASGCRDYLEENIGSEDVVHEIGISHGPNGHDVDHVRTRVDDKEE